MLLFSPDGSRLYSGASDGTVAAWRIAWQAAPAAAGGGGSAGGFRRGATRATRLPSRRGGGRGRLGGPHLARLLLGRSRGFARGLLLAATGLELLARIGPPQRVGLRLGDTSLRLRFLRLLDGSRSLHLCLLDLRLRRLGRPHLVGDRAGPRRGAHHLVGGLALSVWPAERWWRGRSGLDEDEPRGLLDRNLDARPPENRRRDREMEHQRERRRSGIPATRERLGDKAPGFERVGQGSLPESSRARSRGNRPGRSAGSGRPHAGVVCVPCRRDVFGPSSTIQKTRLIPPATPMPGSGAMSFSTETESRAVSFSRFVARRKRLVPSGSPSDCGKS